MKKLLVSMLSLLLLTVLIPQFTFAAQADIKLYFNGKQLNPEVAPRKIGDYSMVPVRIISENMGAKVSWDQAKQMVTIEKADIYMQLVINKKEAVLNSKAITLEAAPVLLAGNTLIPVRFVAERLGLLVDWDDATQSVYVKTPDPSNGGTTPTPSPTPTPKPGVPQITSMESVGDQIVIKASGPIKSKLMYLSNPERLVIDLPGTAFGPGIAVPGAGQMGGVWTANPSISAIRYALNDPATSTIRVVVDLKVKSGYSLIEDGSKGQVVVQLKNAKYKVVLDAGHGDQDPGAISISGKQEKDFNLTMVLKVKKILDQNPNIQVYLTRSDDTFVTLDGRCEFANNLGADVFVSIHGNKWIPSTSGSETYYWRPESLSLANIMHKNLVAAAGLPDRKVRQNDFRVVKYTNMPAVLLEVGYLSSSNDEPQMFNAAFQDRVAGGIANGIKQYLNLN